MVRGEDRGALIRRRGGRLGRFEGFVEVEAWRAEAFGGARVEGGGWWVGGRGVSGGFWRGVVGGMGGGVRLLDFLSLGVLAMVR